MNTDTTNPKNDNPAKKPGESSAEKKNGTIKRGQTKETKDEAQPELRANGKGGAQEKGKIRLQEEKNSNGPGADEKQQNTPEKPEAAPPERKKIPAIVVQAETQAEQTKPPEESRPFTPVPGYSYTPEGLPPGTVPQYTQGAQPLLAGLALGYTGSGYAYGAPGHAAPMAKEKEPFNATRADGWFALGFIPVCFLFVRWMLWGEPWQGWGVTLVTFLYAAVVLGYAYAKGIRPAKASWFWLGILLLTALCYTIWPAGSMDVWQGLLLCGAAIYWCASLFGGLLNGKTSNYMGLDVINLLFVVPFKNFSTAIKSAAILFKNERDSEEKAKNRKNILYVLLGLLVCIPLVALLIGMLLQADEGGFASLLGDVMYFFSSLFSEEFWFVPLQLMLCIPIVLYVFGLASGCAHKRYVANFDVKKTKKNLESLRVIPLVTLVTVLLAASAVYVVFVMTQLPYFFSAFMGIKPPEYPVYSEYAREGFFELCRIAAINLGLLAASNVLSNKARLDSKLLRCANIVLSVLTLLLIATAFSKMGLYIWAQGLTPKRVITCVFMLFLTGVCVAVIVLQFRKFSILRVSAVYGAALLCGLCLVNLDGLVLRYNADRYLKGSLPAFDAVIVERSMPNGIPSALEVYEKEENQMAENTLVPVINAGFAVQTADHAGVRDTIYYAGLRGDGRLPLVEEAEEE